MYLKLIELFNYSKNLFNWLLQERDKLLRYRKQRKKMAKLPKVSEGCQRACTSHMCPKRPHDWTSSSAGEEKMILFLLKIVTVKEQKQDAK